MGDQKGRGGEHWDHNDKMRGNGGSFGTRDQRTCEQSKNKK